MRQLKQSLSHWLEKLANVGVLPSDTEEERLAKAILIHSAALIEVLATFWVVLYAGLALGATGAAQATFWRSAIIPLAYQLISALTFVYYFRTKNSSVFRFSQQLSMLLLPFLLQWSLGGFVASSGVMLWALASPLGALLFNGPRQAVPWFVTYLGLTALSGVLDPYLSKNAAPIPIPLIILFFVLTIASVSSVTFVRVQYFALRREQALRLLRAEQARSERLLLNVLPAPSAERLKRDEEVIADAFDSVTTLFADIVGFTAISERVSPDMMVPWLNDLFSTFDRLAARYGLEKIRTIGDSYMAVGGVPISRPGHAESAADMALDMMQEVARRQTPDGRPLRIRIGINTGPAVGAVVGLDKFIYDVYGDSVNTASRMESQGVPGHIQVTENTYALLCDRYTFDSRRYVQIKGKGEMVMATYMLTGKRAEITPPIAV